MHAAQNPGSKLKYVTLDKESNMSTLWRREEFLRVCSEEDLAEKAQAIEMIIPVGKSQVARYNFDPASFFVNRFWGRRPDGVAINEALRIVNTLEFNRSKERDEGFLEVKEAEANQQHKSIIGAFREAAPKWEFDQIDFVVGNRGYVVESDFYKSSKSLMFKKERKTNFSLTQVCEAHDWVILSFHQHMQGLARPTIEVLRENIGCNMHV